MRKTSAGLPAHYELTTGHVWFSMLSIAATSVLLAAAGLRIVLALEVTRWWIVPALVAGVAAADFGSGLVHWIADTWGRDDCPVLGPRLLVPFRVHHINPDDFLRRRFADTNGEVAFIAIPFLITVLCLPLDSSWGEPLALFGFAFCVVGSMTNQIHQWAHMPSPPAAIRWLQSSGLLLGPVEHASHHVRPYDCRYCIATGWCNRPLEAVDFFRRLERAVTWVTGVKPRHDDQRYQQRYSTLVGTAGVSGEQARA